MGECVVLVACCRDSVTVDASIDIPMSVCSVRLGPVSLSRGGMMLTGRPDDDDEEEDASDDGTKDVR